MDRISQFIIAQNCESKSLLLINWPKYVKLFIKNFKKLALKNTS